MEFNQTSILDLFESNSLEESNITLNDITKGSNSVKLYKIPLLWTITLCSAYGLVFSISLVGNGAVIWLVLPSKRMWNATNIFIGNLAVADIITSFFTSPLHFQAALLQTWELSYFLCPLCPFVQELSILVSVFTLIAIAVQRYQAVVNPLQTAATLSRWSPSLIVSSIWLIAICISIPTSLDFTVEFDLPSNLTTVYCNPTNLSSRTKWFYYQFLVFAQYIVPLVIISLTYRQIITHLWDSTTPGHNDLKRDSAIRNKKKKVAQMMILEVLIFAISWFPYQAYNICRIYFPQINEYYYINLIWLWIRWLAMSNSCVNPFVYAIVNEKFQEEFKTRRGREQGCWLSCNGFRESEPCCLV